MVLKQRLRELRVRESGCYADEWYEWCAEVRDSVVVVPNVESTLTLLCGER